jgi:hypothetical protein
LGTNSRSRRYIGVALFACLLAACLVIAGVMAARAAAAGRERPAATPIVVRIPADPPISPGTPLVTLPWGEGDGQVGLSRPAEGLARGPEALAVAPDGRIAVLDSVNRRVVILDSAGTFQATFSIPLGAARFLAADSEAIHVLDADEDRRLLSFDWRGAVLSTRDFDPGQGTVTGLFSRGGCAYVETEHARVVRARAGDAFGDIDSPGRPIEGRNRAFAQARFSRGDRPRIRLTADPETAEAPRELEFAPDAALEHLVSVDGDQAENMILGARMAQPEATPDGPAALVLVRTSKDGNGPTAALRLYDSSGIAETGQPYVVGPDGRIYQPRATENGYSILVHAFPKGATR